MHGIDPSKIIKYVCKCDRKLPKEKQVVFLLKPLTAKDAADIQDRLTETISSSKKNDKEITMLINSGSHVLKALTMGLKGWENFKDITGAEIKWRENNGTPKPEVFDHIPPNQRQELAEVITEGSEVSEEDEKK